MIDRQIDDEELAIGDRVLAEADMFGRAISFRTVIVKVNPDELWLGLASPDKRLDALRENHPLQLTIARAGAGLLGQSGFLRLLGGSKSRIFAVVRPGALERVQRRAYVRYQLDLPLNFRHVDPATREPRGKASPGITINVGPGGLLFTTHAALQLGEELDFILPLGGLDRASMVGLVTRVRGLEEGAPIPEGESARSEVAVRFTRITAMDQDRVVRFILMTEHRRREAALRELPAPVAPAAPHLQAVRPMAPAVRPVAVPGAVRPAVAAATVAVAARSAPVASPVAAPVAPLEPVLPPIDPDQPLITYGLQLCEQRDNKTVRLWFDSLEPFSRIELLSMLQANMAGSAVAGAPEPASVRPLAVALGLLGS
jgi:c-di-GMP-binding flagellar brake protein YcgR